MSRSERPAPPPSTEFTDRVMTAIRLVPAPTPTRTFIAAVRARALRDAVTTLWVAWHLGTTRSWFVAPRVRARSFALVLAVTSVLASGSLAAAAVVRSVVPQRDERNPVVAPSGSSVDEGPAGSGRTSSEVPRQSEEPTASEAPTPIEHHVVSTSQRPAATDSGHHATNAAHAPDGHHGQGDGSATDSKDEPDASDDAHDGSHDGDRPAATDDHDGSGDSSGSDTSDDHGGSRGSDDAPNSTAEPESGGDGSGG